jgi:hypothetical protein
MADDYVDWADMMAVAMVARDWFDDFHEEHCVRALLAHDRGAFTQGLSVYQPNADRIASALREAYLAGKADQPEAIRDAYASGVEAGRVEANDGAEELAAMREVTAWLDIEDGHHRRISRWPGKWVLVLEDCETSVIEATAMGSDWVSLARALRDATR